MSQRLRSQRKAVASPSKYGQSSSQSQATRARSSQEPVASTSTAIAGGSQVSKVSFDEFGKFHQAVLGVFMASSMLDSSQVRSMFRNACDAVTVSFPEDVGDYLNAVATTVGVINVALKKYSLVIKRVYSGTSMESYYCLVNLAPVAIHRLQEVFKAAELQYLYALVTAIAESEHGYIKRLDALQLSVETRLTQTVAEQHLTKMCSLGFVEQNDKGHVLLGARSLAELEPFLREKNPDAIGKCMLCQGPIGMQGYRCRNDECGKRCHPACLLRLIDPDDVDTESVKCPNCITEDIPRQVLDGFRVMGQKKCADLEKDVQVAKERLENLHQAKGDLDKQATEPVRRKSKSLSESMEE